ncbi:hypothetical protein RYX36_026379 [Vicia faba]
MDVARLIANELKKVALNGTNIGDRTPCQLTYPGLIMGLCNRARVFIPFVGYQVIEGVFNDNYIDNYHVRKKETPVATTIPLAASPPSGLSILGPCVKPINMLSY